MIKFMIHNAGVVVDTGGVMPKLKRKFVGQQTAAYGHQTVSPHTVAVLLDVLAYYLH